MRGLVEAVNAIFGGGQVVPAVRHPDFVAVVRQVEPKADVGAGTRTEQGEVFVFPHHGVDGVEVRGVVVHVGEAGTAGRGDERQRKLAVGRQQVMRAVLVRGEVVRYHACGPEVEEVGLAGRGVHQLREHFDVEIELYATAGPEVQAVVARIVETVKELDVAFDAEGVVGGRLGAVGDDVGQATEFRFALITVEGNDDASGEVPSSAEVLQGRGALLVALHDVEANAAFEPDGDIAMAGVDDKGLRLVLVVLSRDLCPRICRQQERK